jgi:hypothetical protein
MTPALADLLAARRGWKPEQIRLFDAGFTLYWERSAALARRTPTWLPPRLRHVAVVDYPLAVRPYVQLLNTSAWVLYASDFDPARSDRELVAYLLAHGDRLTVGRDVATAAVQSAAWWLERSDAECAAFSGAAAQSLRPDADAVRAIAAALPALRRLHHEVLRPARVVAPYRAVPGTGLLVPGAVEDEPPRLAARCAEVARATLASYRRRWRSPAGAALGALAEWLAGAAPHLLVTTTNGRIVWDPEAPDRTAGLRAELSDADAVSVEAIAEDLHVIDRHTRAFHAALVDPAALPAPRANTDQSGYSYLHAGRRLIAYNLREPGMERLVGPPLPYARAMLGARTAHEWAHLVEAAGWVPRTASHDRWTELKRALAEGLDDTIAAAPGPIRTRTASDLARLSAEASAGAALVRILLTRLPDYKANLVTRNLMTEDESETYVRHNVRTLRYEYPNAELWRTLIRYLYEYQYLSPALGLTAVPDPRTYFLRSTWFANDFLATDVLDDAQFDRLAECVAGICAAYAVDETRFYSNAKIP